MSLPNFITNPNPDIFLGDNYVTIDFENAHYNNGFPSAIYSWASQLLSCWKHSTTDVSVLWGNEYEQDRLLSAINKADFLVAHNAKHELQWLSRMGMDISKLLVFDTMIAEYVLLGNRQGRLDLATVSKKHGFGGKDPYVDVCMKAGICPSELPKSMLEDRCVKDVEQTEQVFLKQRQLLKESDRLKTLFTRCIFTPVLSDIEMNGLCLDGGRVEKTYRDYKERLRKCSKELDGITGGINPRSPKQMGEFIYDTLGFSEFKDRRGNPIRTEKDGRKTDVATIARLAPSNKRQRDFLEKKGEYAKLQAAVSKNLDFFYGAVVDCGGIFYGAFNQCVTRTHRLSSSGRPIKFGMFDKNKSVQFQNLPQVFKPLFTARHRGWSVGEADGSQLEFRVAAHLGKDKVAIQDIINKEDVHSVTASTITAAGQKINRQEAKAHTFKPLFGGSSGTTAEKAYYELFNKKYNGISSTQKKWCFTVVEEKELQIPSGLIFYWPDTAIQKSGYITNSTKINNAPIQSYATADIVPIAITKLWHDMKNEEMQSFLVNTVHDSGIGEIHPDEREEWKCLANKAFTEYVYYYLDRVYDDKFSVPLGTGIKIGEHWSEGEEESFALMPGENT